MSSTFVRRIASDLLGRGESAIRFNPNSKEEISKAITRDDVRALIHSKAVFALPMKKNQSANSKILKEKRDAGRRRGRGKRKGTLKARGTMSWEKKVRSQRALIKELKKQGKLDTKTFSKYYGLVKGNVFPDKASLIRNLKSANIEVSDEFITQLKEKQKERYR
jgi:large subunit ribosomal protein L19e